MKRDDDIYVILEWLLGKKDADTVKDNVESIMNSYWYAEMLKFVTIANFVRELRDEIEKLKREIQEIKKGIKELENGVV